MKIAILETGLPPLSIRDRFQRYPDMFRNLLANAAPDLQTQDFNIDEDELPQVKSFDGFLITGSPAGVYERHKWLPGLFDFIREAAAAHKPQIGICFGHQAIAQALGGEVIKSPKGWGVGRHEYVIAAKPDWWEGDETSRFALAVSHQDQVTSKPQSAQVLARSDFTPNAALFYPAAPALSFQGHPEFDDAFAAALYKARRGNPLIPEVVDAAISSLAQPDDNARVAQWMAKFYRWFI